MIPSAILLDAMGTLVRLPPPAPALVQELERRLGVHVSEAEAAAALAVEIAYYRRHMHRAGTDERVRALQRWCAEVLRDALPARPGLAEASVDTLTGVLLGALRFEAFPDAGPALAAARARGQRLVVVSNWDASLPDVLARLGLAPLLDGVLASAACGVAKPDGAIFERALALAGVEPAAALHVGDSVSEDVEGARRAGVRPVLLQRAGGPPPPDVETIATLSELAAVGA